MDEFKSFLPTVQDPFLRVAFLLLFYAGLRCGEMLALTAQDFDPVARTITVRGTFHRFNRVDSITTPKTERSQRTITLPTFLAEELRSVLGRIYDVQPEDRIFTTVTASKLYTAIEKGSAAAQVKRIRIHDLRHLYVKPTTKIKSFFQPM